jgi:pimeloyl-ACP methyl ester carboxylesterase
MATARKPGLKLIRSSGSAEAQSGYVKAADGTKIFFQDSGGKGTPLVFIYGLGCSIQHWKYPLRALSHSDAKLRGYRCIWSDIRGHGKSAMPPRRRPIRLDDVINDQMSVLSHLKVDQAVFLGQSMGGCLAMELAYRFPSSTAGMILLGTPARDPSRLLPFQPVAKMLWDAMLALNETLPILVRGIYRQVLPSMQKAPVRIIFREMIRQKGFNAKLAKTADIEDYIEAFFSVHPNVFYQMAATLSGYDAGRYEQKILAPTLIIAGRQDQVIPLSEAEYLHAQLRHSQLEVLPHGSHCPHFDDPVLVAGLIRRFLATHKI